MPTTIPTMLATIHDLNRPDGETISLRAAQALGYISHHIEALLDDGKPYSGISPKEFNDLQHKPGLYLAPLLTRAKTRKSHATRYPYHMGQINKYMAELPAELPSRLGLQSLSVVQVAYHHEYGRAGKVCKRLPFN